MSVPVLRSTTTGRTMLDDGDEEYVDNDGYDDYADLMTMTIFCVVFLMVEGYVTQVANYRPDSIAVDTIP